VNVSKLLWAMATIHKNLLICVLYKDTVNSSGRSMLNVWFMSQSLMGEGKYDGCIISLAKS
jgi:hypothetical protein